MERNIKEYFDTETMPEELTRQIEGALTAQTVPARRPRFVRGAAVAATLALVLLFAFSGPVTTAFAEVYDFFIHPQNPGVTESLGRWGDDWVVSYGGIMSNDTGFIKNGIYVAPNTASPIAVEDCRLYFIANGERLDITDVCSEETAYVYVLQDNTGIRHYFIIGGTPDSPGYQIFLQIPGGEYGGWVCGGAAGIVTNASGWMIREWVYDGQHQVGHPWPLIDNTEPDNGIILPAPGK